MINDQFSMHDVLRQQST